MAMNLTQGLSHRLYVMDGQGGPRLSSSEWLSHKECELCVCEGDDGREGKKGVHFWSLLIPPVHLSLYLCGFLLFSVTAQLIIEARREFGVGRRLDAASI